MGRPRPLANVLAARGKPDGGGVRRRPRTPLNRVILPEPVRGVRAGLARASSEGKRLGRPPIAPALEKRIREALATPGRPGVRVIAKRFGVDPGTVQRISRPFADLSVVAAVS